MSIKGYLQFVKWYFVHAGNAYFPERGRRYNLGRKDRVPFLILAYILLIVAFPLALFLLKPFGLACFSAAAAIFGALTWFVECRFSFIYYFILYKKYLHREDSVNDRIIVEYKILGEYPMDIARMISKYYYVHRTKSSRKGVLYDLVIRRKKRSNFGKKDLFILEITHDKILFNKQVVFSEKIKDLTVLEDFLREMQKQTG